MEADGLIVLVGLDEQENKPRNPTHQVTQHASYIVRHARTCRRRRRRSHILFSPFRRKVFLGANMLGYSLARLGRKGKKTFISYSLAPKRDGLHLSRTSRPG